MLGLVKGKVELYDHEKLWEENAQQTIIFLQKVFGDIAIDIQHIGSTAIKTIKAKPIIDIVVGVTDINKVKLSLSQLNSSDIIHRPNNDRSDYMMFILGDLEKGIRTHHIHVVPFGSEEWNNQLNFRDYMNLHPDKAKEYESLKINFLNLYKDNRPMHTKSKEEYIKKVFDEAAHWRRRTAK